MRLPQQLHLQHTTLLINRHGRTQGVLCRDFFGPDAQSIFEACWKPVLALVCSEVDDHLHGYFDVVGVLVMTRIVGHCQLLMTHAQVPVLDSFLDRVSLMLWPHFSRLIREHIDSVTNGMTFPCVSL